MKRYSKRKSLVIWLAIDLLGAGLLWLGKFAIVDLARVTH